MSPSTTSVPLSASAMPCAMIRYAKTVRESEQSWQDYINSCVKAVNDADKDLKKDLEAVVKDGYGAKNDETLGTGFNGDAGKVAAADDQKKQERMELASLGMRDGETLDDWLMRLQRDGVEKLSGSKALADLFAGVQKGTVTAGAFARALGGSVSSGLKLYKYLKKQQPVTAAGTFLGSRINMRVASAAPGSFWSKLPPNLVTALTGSDEAARFGSYVKNGSLFSPRLPSRTSSRWRGTAAWPTLPRPQDGSVARPWWATSRQQAMG